MIKYKVFIYLIFIFLSISFIPFILTEIERDKGIKGNIMCLSLSILRAVRIYGERIKGIKGTPPPFCEEKARQRVCGEKIQFIWKAVGHITWPVRLLKHPLTPKADYRMFIPELVKTP